MFCLCVNRYVMLPSDGQPQGSQWSYRKYQLQLQQQFLFPQMIFGAFMYPEDQNHPPEIFMDCPVSMLVASSNKFHMKLWFNAFPLAWGVVFTCYSRIIVPLPVRQRRKEYVTSETLLGAMLALENKKKEQKSCLCFVICDILLFVKMYMHIYICTHICIFFYHFMKEIEVKFVKLVIPRIWS